MNYKDKYIKYKNKYLQNQVGGSKEASVASVASTLPPTKPKSVPTQDQGNNGTCWAHSYARSFVRTFQILDIITDNKVEEWYDLFYAILLQGKTCDKGDGFNKMVYLFNFLKNNIDEIFRITKENIKCVNKKCSQEEKNIPILEFDTKEEEEIKRNLRFLFDNELIFLAIYPYAVNPNGINSSTQAIKKMLDLRLQPVLGIHFSNSLVKFVEEKTSETYDLFSHNDSIKSEDHECNSNSGHKVVLRSWRNNIIEIKNSWGPNGNFAINDLKDLTCKDGKSLSDSIIEIECLMINYNKLDNYKDLKKKVDDKIATYHRTIDPNLISIENENYRCSYDEYGFPNGENCELKDYEDKIFFKGNLIRGIKNGKSDIYIDSNGSNFQGDWENNIRIGNGISTYKNGDVYVGTFIDNKRHGKGKYTSFDKSKYDGDWKNDKRHGKGIMTYEDNSVYEGDWIDNRKNGHGIFYYPNGDMYNGNWQYDKRNGRGTISYYDNDTNYVYDGNWIDDKKNGHGILNNNENDKYDGNWENDKKNGKGTQKYANGDVYEGNWIDNFKNGIGTQKYANGNVYEGNWENDMQNGLGTFNFIDGSIYSGHWINGMKNGIGEEIFRDRSVYGGYWENNKKHGYGILKSDTGTTIRKGKWENDKPVL
jgi:hypothetical protein